MSIDEDARAEHPYLPSGIPLVYLGNHLVYSYLVYSSTTPPETSLTLQGEVGGGFLVYLFPKVAYTHKLSTS